MTRERFAFLAATALPGFAATMIDRPIRETGLDSFDLMMLRSALETEMGSPIPDEDWFASESMAALIDRLR
jgi:acyl carrier protein